MIMLISLALLLAGTFLFRNIRMGALAAVVVQIAHAVIYTGWHDEHTSAVANGLAIGFELALLLFGAVAFYQVLLDNKRLAFLDHFVATSPSPSYLLITYSIFLGTFFEGIAGFGVPPILLIPLLVKSGFRPITAIVTALSGSLNAVLFGALGAPLIIGLGVREPNPMVDILVLIDALSCLAMPFIITYFCQVLEGADIKWKQNFPMLLGAGVIYVLLLFIGSRFTVEFPSVITGSLGMILFMLIYNPAVRTWGLRFWINSFWPYGVLIVLLLMIKFLLGNFSIVVPGGTKVISAYQPGAIFLIAIILVTCLVRMSDQPFHAWPAITKSLQRAAKSVFTIWILVTFSQLVRGEMVASIGTFIAQQPEALETYLLTIFGITGSFITGSATMSNLLLNGILTTTVIQGSLAMAMLHTGSVLGNVIALQNIVMARSATDEIIHDRDVMRYTIRALIVCVLCVVISATLWQFTRT